MFPPTASFKISVCNSIYPYSALSSPSTLNCSHAIQGVTNRWLCLSVITFVSPSWLAAANWLSNISGNSVHAGDKLCKRADSKEDVIYTHVDTFGVSFKCFSTLEEVVDSFISYKLFSYQDEYIWNFFSPYF